MGPSLSSRGSGSRVPWAALGLVAVVFGVSLLDPPHPTEQLLQHAPTVVALPLLALAARRRWCGDRDFLLLALFLLLHVIGARFKYTFTPGGESLTWLGLGGPEDRNHYDRLVHLASGLLLVPPLAAVIGRGLAGRLLAAAVVVAIGALYEIFEWILTIVASPDYAEGYNGQQGDPWDAHKDMALAAVGALLAAFLIPTTARARPRATPTPEPGETT
ncbi:MAG: DUF2238 domain-containing protein [Planctomycetota bacterium]